MDREHVIDVIPDLTKPDIKDQWNQARQPKDSMVSEIFYASVCACCGHRCPHSGMRIGFDKHYRSKNIGSSDIY